MLEEHPHIAAIDCEDCKKWMYDLTTGTRKLHGNDPIPVRKPPCHDDLGAERIIKHGDYSLAPICPKVRPGYSDLTPGNWELLRFYRYCRSVDRWPEDDLQFDRFRVVLQKIERQAEKREDRRRQNEMILNMAKMMSKRR